MFVFQTDSDIVRNVYDTQHNYLIEYNEQCKDKTYCAVYFCSNDLYYPNVEDIFRKRIVEKNFFEWYNLRIEKAYKHIFVRDVFKQWYLSGINQSIDSPERLIEFLKMKPMDTVLSCLAVQQVVMRPFCMVPSSKSKGICFQSSSRIDIPINKE